jgi:hypothetical protein
MTNCIARQMELEGLGKRRVEAAFDGGWVSSDGGAILLRETEKRVGLLRRFAECFIDHRDPARVEFSKEHLVAQRTMMLALGYEDLNDHDALRHDPLLATAIDVVDPTGMSRKRERDKGIPLAGKSTLNRLELTPENVSEQERYKKIEADPNRIERLFVDHFLDSHKEPPEEIILDLDATDDPLHGKQEGRFFHGYYGHYCYLPLYIFCDDFLLCAKLRPSNIDGAAGAIEEVACIVDQIRESWPDVRIILRADSGFTRESLMVWAEESGVDFILGLARNSRLNEVLADEMALAREEHEETGRPARRFKDFWYITQDSWTWERRVVGKAEMLPGKSNPRYVVTSLGSDEWAAKPLYEDLYCARGDMENRIKEQQLDLFADRTSTHWLHSNQLRLWMSSVAYLLVAAMRRLGLKGTEHERAQAGTIRTRLMKIGALITVSVRRVRIRLSESYPWQDLFLQVYQNLKSHPLVQ